MSGKQRDHLQGPGAREAAARRSPLTTSTTKKGRDNMSSHREAPEISKDPVADNTDTYAFVSPDNPDTVTIITNYLPAEVPAGGPTFFEFGNDVLYTIHIDNNGDGMRRHRLQVHASNRQLANPNTFLYNTGPIRSLADPNWSKRQFYTRHARTTRPATTRAGGRPRVPALQHRPALDPELRDARRGSDPLAPGRPEGVRRAAQRSVLR